MEKLSEARNILNELKNNNEGPSNPQLRPIPRFGVGSAKDPRQGNSIRTPKEKVDLPSEDQYKGALEFRAEILKAMKGNYPRQYERFVSEYYKELVK